MSHGGRLADVNGLCAECNVPGGPCCGLDDTCLRGHVCEYDKSGEFGTCVECGGLRQRCCGGGKCDTVAGRPLTCDVEKAAAMKLGKPYLNTDTCVLCGTLEGLPCCVNEQYPNGFCQGNDELMLRCGSEGKCEGCGGRG